MFYLVTGAAGFIGFHVARQLLYLGVQVVGYDNVNDYYDISLKEARLEELNKLKGFHFIRADLEDYTSLNDVFINFKPKVVIHLAAQAGVRYSLDNPHAYVQSNLVGFMNVLECCRHHDIKHCLYASSSSVYGSNEKQPFSVNDRTDTPLSLYAATKKSNELMAYTYSHLFRIPITGMRFFTVYGPWGRPDMAVYLFTEAIWKDEPIKVFNNGDLMRDFTYIDDIVQYITLLIEKSTVVRDTNGLPPHKVYNIGSNAPTPLTRFISILEDLIGKKAKKIMMPHQPGDVVKTYAEITELIADTGIEPKTSMTTGISNFLDWWHSYNNYHK